MMIIHTCSPLHFDTARFPCSHGFLQVWCVAPLLFDQSFLPSKRHGLKPFLKQCNGWLFRAGAIHGISCQVQEQFLGDLLILRAAKPIAAGEAGSR